MTSVDARVERPAGRGDSRDMAKEPQKGDNPDGPLPTEMRFDRYKFTFPRRGRAIIINNHTFDRRLTGQQDRDGTDVDAAALENVFMALNFEVTRYDNLTTLDMSMNMRAVATEDHSDADCFACAILSHGEMGEVYGTNGKIKIDNITKNFKADVCPTLAGKPKLFFIQACRGRRFDWGATVADGVEDETDAGSIDDQSIRRIPVEADYLVAYSVVPGYFSWRNNVDGSWFVQAICRVLREHGHTEELMRMMTLINKVVAYDFESCTDDDFTSKMKQVPCMVSTLTKEVFFTPKY